MRTIIGRLLGATVLTVLGVLCAAALWAAPRYLYLCFEGEDGHVTPFSPKAKVFYVKKYSEDASGRVSGKKVLAVPKSVPGLFGPEEQDKKPPPEEVTYKVRVPESGKYCLWMRTLWTSGCGNSFGIKVEGQSGKYVIGGDATYDTQHWLCLNDGDTSKPLPMTLAKGVVTITLIAKESGTMVDQFLLTTDSKVTPANVYKPTPDLLVKETK